MRRGDNIPPVSDYAHWNEEAYSMWWEENKYDIQNFDEPIEPDDDERDYEPEPFSEAFETEAEARAFLDGWDIDMRRDTLSEWDGKWYVEHYNEWAHNARNG